MRYDFEISQLAELDLENIWLYTLQNWSHKQADKYYRLIISEIYSICDNPEIGKAIEELKMEHRVRKIESHIIIYKIKRDKIWIDRILHQRMDIESRLIE